VMQSDFTSPMTEEEVPDKACARRGGFPTVRNVWVTGGRRCHERD
jgi:hypothetical protein